MNAPARRAIFAVTLIAFLLTVPGGIMTAKPTQDKPKVSTAELWKKVEAADRDDLPRTAVEHLKEIVQISIEQKREGLICWDPKGQRIRPQHIFNTESGSNGWAGVSTGYPDHIFPDCHKRIIAGKTIM